MENRLSRSSARGRKLYTKEGRKNQTGCLFSMSFKEPSHQRSEAALFFYFPSSLLHMLTYTPIISHSNTHLGCISCRSSCVFFFFFPLNFRCFIPSALNHIFCFAPSLRDKPVELIASPSLPSSSAFLSRCVYDSVITLSSLRWPIILGSSGVMQRVLD